MKIILAMDNDAAGYQAVWRILEREIGNIEIVLTPGEMMPEAYRLWLAVLTPAALAAELDRLKTEGDPEHNLDDITKARLLADQFRFCKEALDYKKHVNKFFEALI
jgi:DNA primase